MHDLGSCEVKHGVRVLVVNLYDDQFGNAKLPRKFETVQKRRTLLRWAEVAVALLVLAAIIAGVVFLMRRPTSSAMAIGEKSIAVLPFENLSERKAERILHRWSAGRNPDGPGKDRGLESDQPHLGDAIQEWRSPVICARSVQQLGVAHVLEGSVQRAVNKVRVNAQLIDARTDAHLWAQTYDRDLADVFAIQSEIAKAIADQLQAKLSPSEKKAIEQPPTTDLAAFDLYSRAK